MLVVLGALLDPLGQQSDFLATQTFPFAFGWHHFLVSLGQGDSEKNFAGFGIAWNNGGVSVQVTSGALEDVQSKFCLALPLVRSVTGKASVGEQGFDIPIEIYLSVHLLGKEKTKHLKKTKKSNWHRHREE
jgi:hypothetical protein